eukprot:TRINITY_DN1292_c0_g1_i1.p1 TRINITY_DN1292_c0_g1~~TRINITY_DN1292_c0_g1_i1.p1  ORF type:complete len:266 (-),score=28.61 TRINITY_DN1292_c0_g1_i1:1861-2658(-)
MFTKPLVLQHPQFRSSTPQGYYKVGRWSGPGNDRVSFNPMDTNETFLPNNVVWLDPGSCKHDVLYGGNFVIRREKIGGPGLVLYQKTPATLQKLQNRCTSTQVVVAPKVFTTPPTVFGENDIETVEYVIFQDEEEESQNDVVSIDRITTNIILHPLYSNQHQENKELEDPNLYETGSNSPRRTSKVRFTCNLCRAVNLKAVNPAAFKTGTIFAKCGKCGVTHKLIDNLNVVQEMVIYHPPTNFFKNRGFKDSGPFPGEGSWFDIL